MKFSDPSSWLILTLAAMACIRRLAPSFVRRHRVLKIFEDVLGVIATGWLVVQGYSHGGWVRFLTLSAIFLGVVGVLYVWWQARNRNTPSAESQI